MCLKGARYRGSPESAIRHHDPTASISVAPHTDLSTVEISTARFPVSSTSGPRERGAVPNRGPELSETREFKKGAAQMGKTPGHGEHCARGLLDAATRRRATRARRRRAAILMGRGLVPREGGEGQSPGARSLTLIFSRDPYDSIGGTRASHCPKSEHGGLPCRRLFPGATVGYHGLATW